MWAVAVYCGVVGALGVFTVVFYLFERNQKLPLVVSEVEQMKPVSSSVLHTVETQRYDESMNISEKPKRSSYKKANLKIEIPETPRSLADGPEIQCSQLLVPHYSVGMPPYRPLPAFLHCKVQTNVSLLRTTLWGLLRSLYDCRAGSSDEG